MMQGKKEATTDVVILQRWQPADISGDQSVSYVSSDIVNNNLNIYVSVKNNALTTKTYLIEAQPSGGAKTGKKQSLACDATAPYNRHDIKTIASGNTATFIIDIPTSDIINYKGYGTYYFRLISYDTCCPNSNPLCKAVSPFYDYGEGQTQNVVAKVQYTTIPTTYQCTGTPGEHWISCGDTTGLTSNTPIILVNSCTTTTNCEYVCDWGYEIVNNACVDTGAALEIMDFYYSPTTNIGAGSAMTASAVIRNFGTAITTTTTQHPIVIIGFYPNRYNWSWLHTGEKFATGIHVSLCSANEVFSKDYKILTMDAGETYTISLNMNIPSSVSLLKDNRPAYDNIITPRAEIVYPFSDVQCYPSTSIDVAYKNDILLNFCDNDGTCEPNRTESNVDCYDCGYNPACKYTWTTGTCGGDGCPSDKKSRIGTLTSGGTSCDDPKIECVIDVSCASITKTCSQLGGSWKDICIATESDITPSVTDHSDKPSDKNYCCKPKDTGGVSTTDFSQYVGIFIGIMALLVISKMGSGK